MATKRHKTIDAYIGAFPDDVKPVLQAIRQTIRKAAPNATETIAYDMPAFEPDGDYLIYFAAWKKHVSLYPISASMERSMCEIAAYKTSGRGTIRFPLDKPLPLALIRRIVRRRVKETKEKAASRRIGSAARRKRTRSHVT